MAKRPHRRGRDFYVICSRCGCRLSPPRMDLVTAGQCVSALRRRGYSPQIASAKRSDKINLNTLTQAMKAWATCKKHAEGCGPPVN